LEARNICDFGAHIFVTSVKASNVKALGRCAHQEISATTSIAVLMTFWSLERWASPEALAAHERTEAFINFGQGVLAKHAMLHDAVSGRPFL
jgi:hypothetical protein